MVRKLLRFFEYEKIDFRKVYGLVSPNSDLFHFEEKYQNALYEFHTLSKGAYYSLVNNGIAFVEHVGAIQVHDLTIEVLPKIDRGEKDSDKWHRILLDMLKACKLLSPKSSQDASLRLRSNSILELYFQKYLVEMECLLHTGLIKRYRKTEGNVKVLKGTLQFQKQIQKNLVHAERFYTHHTIYDKNHLLHQVLRKALEVVAKLSNSSSISERSKILMVDWPEAKGFQVSTSTFDQIVLNRKSEVYKEALSIARLILLNYHPDIRGGRSQVIALMFNMNNLWEEFIYQRLKYAGQANNWTVINQKGILYWASNHCKKKLIPDIIIQHKLTGKRVVIDTKWKRPRANKPDDSDLRQILAYKLYFHSNHAFLLYPNNVWQESFGEYYNRGFKSAETVFKEGVSPSGGLLFASVMASDKKLQPRSAFCESDLVHCLKASLE